MSFRHHGIGQPQVADGGNGLQIWAPLRVYWIHSCKQATRGSPQTLWMGVELAASHRKKQTCYGILNWAGIEQVRWTYVFWFRMETSGDSSYEHDNEPPSFIKFREFLDTLGNCYLLKMVSSPWSYLNFNSLNTKRRLLYLKTQFVPRSKHFSSRL